MRIHLAYLKYLLLHKFWVLVEGLKLEVNLGRLIIHDYDKFFPKQWIAYAYYFNSIRTEEVRNRFRQAWRYHVNRNDHHYNHWVGITEQGRTVVHEMSDMARREMLADWISANKVISGTIKFGQSDDLQTWYNKRRDLLPIGPQTLRWLDYKILKENN